MAGREAAVAQLLFGKWRYQTNEIFVFASQSNFLVSLSLHFMQLLFSVCSNDKRDYQGVLHTCYIAMGLQCNISFAW